MCVVHLSAQEGLERRVTAKLVILLMRGLKNDGHRS